MKCLSCDCEEFEVKKIPIHIQIFDKESDIEGYVCKNCDVFVMDSEQMNKFIRWVRDVNE